MSFFNRARSSNPERSISREYVTVVLLCLVWTTGIAIAPLLSSGGSPIGVVTHLFYAPVCHQDAARSFTFSGIPFAVCARCTAVYFSFTAILVAGLLSRWIRSNSIPFRLLLLGIAPMLIDVILDAAGVIRNSMPSRTITGAIAGSTFGLFLAPVLSEGMTAVSDFIKHRSIKGGIAHE